MVLPAVRRVILFDGVCNLCNGFVQFIIQRDRHDRFKFGALQSQASVDLLRGREVPSSDVSTVIYLRGDRIMLRSTAALNILKDLGGTWGLLYAFMLVPKVLRDLAYGWVAKNRYRWFGKRDVCMIPSPELRGKFIGSAEPSVLGRV